MSPRITVPEHGVALCQANVAVVAVLAIIENVQPGTLASPAPAPPTARSDETKDSVNTTSVAPEALYSVMGMPLPLLLGTLMVEALSGPRAKSGMARTTVPPA